MLQPGQDYNYPTSSGNAAGFLGQSVTVNGFHITFGLLGFILAMLIVWKMARKRSR